MKVTISFDVDGSFEHKADELYQDCEYMFENVEITKEWI